MIFNEIPYIEINLNYDLSFNNKKRKNNQFKFNYSDIDKVISSLKIKINQKTFNSLKNFQNHLREKIRNNNR